MLNFVRFDLSKMLRMKSLWITLFIFNLFLGIITYVNYHEISMTYEEYSQQMRLQEEGDQEESSDNGTKVEVELILESLVMDEASFNVRKDEIKESMTFDRFVLDNFAPILIFAYIYLAIFVSGDFSSGYLKNMLAIRGAKQKWLAAKLITALVFHIILIANHMVFGLINELISGQFLIKISWMDHLTIFLPQVVMLVIIMMLVTAVLLLSQSRVTTIVFATLLGMGLHGQILNFLGQSLNLDLVQQLYSSQLMVMGTNFADHLLPVLIRGALMILGLYLFNSWRIYRMDFKFEH